MVWDLKYGRTADFDGYGYGLRLLTSLNSFSFLIFHFLILSLGPGRLREICGELGLLIWWDDVSSRPSLRLRAG